MKKLLALIFFACCSFQGGQTRNYTYADLMKAYVRGYFAGARNANANFPVGDTINMAAFKARLDSDVAEFHAEFLK